MTNQRPRKGDRQTARTDGVRKGQSQWRSRWGPRSTVAAISALVVATVAAGWALWHRGVHPAVQHGACRGCNVLLITIDTLRSDRVGAFGGPTGLTPTLDRLAGEGLRLTRAYTAAPLTLPAHTSLLTGVSPPVHGVRTNGLFRLGPGLPTLATILKGAGYRTGAFVGAFVLDARFGLTRGFDVYDDRYGEKHAGDVTEGAERRAEEVIKPALTWILGDDRISGPDSRHPKPESHVPWFAWVHLYDPHMPYRAPEPYASKHAPYDAEVAYTDAMVGKLIATLGASAQLDHTLIVVAADHGESLGERGEATHGVFAYDVTLRVPWIIWAGSRIVGESWDGLSRLIDLAPTTLDLVGISGSTPFEGRSIVGAVAARERLAPPAYFEAMDANLTRNWAPLTGIIGGTEKLIDLPIPELYDLAADRGETTNLFAQSGERARVLTALLRTTTSALAQRATAGEKTTLGADARERLQALGYVASIADAGHRVYSDADDPKTLIGPANDLNAALGDFKTGSRERAMTAVRAIMQAHPRFSTTYGVLASMQRDTGDLQAAIGTLEGAVRGGMADSSVMVVLAGYLQEAGALDRSVQLLGAVIAAHPDYAEAYNSLGVAYSRMGRHPLAQAAFRRVLELDPTSATTYENLGLDRAAGGDPAGGVADLQRALQLDPDLANAHNALAAMLLQQGHRAEALEHWRKAVQLDAHLYDALYNLGTVLYSSGERAEAKRYLQRFVTEAPPARYAQDLGRVRRLLSQ